jgi:CheY-like chemotaxis protein
MGVLFEAFVQAQSGLHSLEGAGLGLALSRNLVHMMDGDIFAMSELGTGTVFTIELPLPEAREALPGGKGRIVGLAADQPEYRVLVVDDVHEDRTLLASLLRAVGFDVREAENGVEAVEFWRAWSPHLIWMDARMRVLDGYEATRRIRAAEMMNDECGMMNEEKSAESGTDVRQSPATPVSIRTPHSTKIVAVTTSAFAHEREGAIANGADEFAIKPLVELEIYARMAELLGARFVYEEAEPAARPRISAGAGLDSEIHHRLAAIPHNVIAQLNSALTIGDDRIAREIVEWIGSQDAPLAGELDALLRQFRFDEIAHLIERIPLKAGRRDVE